MNERTNKTKKDRRKEKKRMTTLYDTPLLYMNYIHNYIQQTNTSRGHEPTTMKLPIFVYEQKAKQTTCGTYEIL